MVTIAPNSCWAINRRDAETETVIYKDEVDTAFIDQLTADNDVEDFSVYTVPCITDNQLCILELTELEEI